MKTGVACLTVGAVIALACGQASAQSSTRFHALANQFFEAEEKNGAGIERKLRALPRSTLLAVSSQLNVKTGPASLKALPAAFTLACLNIETKVNLARMSKVHEGFRKALRPENEQYRRDFELYAKAVESLPWAYWRVFKKTLNPSSAQQLWEMKLDGARSESQMWFLAKCIDHNPRLVLGAITLRRDTKTFGLATSFDSNNKAKRKAVLTRLSRGRDRAATSARNLLSYLARV